MTNARNDILNWWAVEAMIASYNHVYQVVYGTRYEEAGPIGVSLYNDAPIASFHYEFLALSADIHKVTDAVRAYPIPEGKKHIVNIFHTSPSDLSLKEHFSTLGYEFARAAPIVGYDLPLQVSTIPLNIHKAISIQQTEAANNSLTTEGERIHVQTLRDTRIHNFFIKEGGLAVGWVQLVTKYRGVGYINQLYVLEEYRQRRLATALVHVAHSEAIRLGVKKMVAIPSDMSLHLFRRMGYRPLLFFSVFRPKPFRKTWLYDQPGVSHPPP